MLKETTYQRIPNPKASEWGAAEYEKLAAQELIQQLSSFSSMRSVNVYGGIESFRSHGWGKGVDHLFFLADPRSGLVYPVGINEMLGWKMEDDDYSESGFYRSVQGVPLYVTTSSPLGFAPADYHTVAELGKSTDDGDKLLVVTDDEHVLQNCGTSAVAFVAPGAYKLSGLKKPNSDWDESYWY